MRKSLIFLTILAASLSAYAQTDAIQNHCYLGGTKATVQGLNSSNYLLGIIPSCTVTVYLTGTTTLATIYKDSSGTPLSNPFTANTVSSVNPGGWIFWAADGQGYDVVMSGGIPPLVYLNPVTLTDLKVGGGGGGGGGLTSFSAGNLNPLFNTTVSNPGTTPSLNFIQQNAPANTLFGNFTGVSGPPFFATFTCTGLLTCSYDGTTNIWNVNLPSTSTLSVTATSPIRVNGGTGPVSSGTANIDCPTCGQTSGIDMRPSGLPAGQYVIVYPTASGHSDSNDRTTSTTGSAIWQGNTVYNNGSIYLKYATSSFPPALGTITFTFTNALETQYPTLNPANITAVYMFAKAGWSGNPNVSPSIACSTFSFTLGAQTQLYDQNLLMTGTDVDDRTCTAQISDSLNNPWPGIASIGLFGFAVYYTGSPVPSIDNSTQVIPPLQLVDNQLQIDPSFPQWVWAMPVSRLSTFFPVPAAYPNITVLVNDYNSSTQGTCAGGGSTLAWATTSGTSTFTCTPILGSGGGSGTVTNVATGTGLTGGPITTTGTISCVDSTSSTKGCVQVDGTTIVASAGVISAPGGGGGLSGQTVNYLPKATSATTSTTSSAVEDQGSALVYHGTGNSHGISFPASSVAITPAASTAIYESDSSGNGVLSENGAAASRVCTASNGVCTTGGVTQIVAGTNVTISPVGGTGVVTVNSAGGTVTPTWTRQGALILPGANDPSPQVQEPSGIFGACESNQYSSYSSCLKIAYTSGWVSTGSGGAGTQTCFKETPGGTNSPIPIGTCISNHDRPSMYLIAGNYVLFAKNESTNGMDIYQASTVAGLSSGLLHSNVLACGTNGNETAGSIGRVGLWGSGTTWRLLYSCLDSSNNSYAEWLATASSATSATWTKASGTPKIGSTGAASSTNCFDYSGAQVYVISGNNLALYGHCGPAGLVPTPYIWRSTSTDNGTTWAQDATFTIQAQTADEGVNNTNGQLGDPYLVDGGSLGRTLLLYGAYTNGCANLVNCPYPSRIKMLSLNQSLATIINETTTDGSSLRDIPVDQINGYPMPYNSLSFQGANISYGSKGVVQTDGPGDQFQTGAGALSSNWTGSANLVIQAAGNVGDTAAGTTNDFAYYTGSLYSANQCSYVTIGAVPATGQWVAAGVRLTSGLNGYAVLSVNTSSTTNTYQMYKVVSGTFTTIGTAPVLSGKMSVGDVIGLCVTGTSLKSYRNGVLAETVTDSTNAGPGYAGMGLPSNNTAQISNFSSSGWVPSPIPYQALQTIPADSLVMNNTASAASPQSAAMPTSGTNGCSGASDALTYNNSTHTIGCNTISVSGGNYVNIGSAVTFSSTGGTGSFSGGKYATTNGSNTAITISSIPGTYLHLRILLKGSGSVSQGAVTTTFNSDTGADYAVQGFFNTAGGTVTSLSSVGAAGCVNFPQLNSTAGTAGISSATMEIPFYADANVKSATVYSSAIQNVATATNNQFVGNTCAWNKTGTPAITSITFTVASAGTFASGFEIAIYGEN